MAAESYYVKSGESEKGPYAVDTLRTSLHDGSLKRDTLVRAEGKSDWVRLDTVVEIAVVEIAVDAAAMAAFRNDAEGKAQMKEHERNRDALVGGLSCLFAIVFTTVSYAAAKNAGSGRFLVASGAIAFGVLRLFRALKR